MDSDKDKSIDRSDGSDSEVIRICELELKQIEDRRITRVAKMEQANSGFTTRKSEVRSEKRKAREEDTNSEDDYVTVEKRRPKRLLRSISTGQGQKTTSKEIGSKYEVCVTSFKELPKQMALAKLLRSENIQNIETIKYKSPFKVLICFQSDNDAEKMISCKKFQDLEYKCQKTFETTVSYGLIRGVDLEFTEEDILAILKSDIKILAVRRLKRLDLNSKWVESETVRICFQGTILPPYVTAYEYNFKVENYTFPVTQCTGCWKFGHIIKACPTKKILCPKCGSTEHINCDLKTYRCLNCKGLHFVLDKSCPMYLKEKEIRITMSKENITYRKALQMIINKSQIEMSENLNMHSKNTFVNQEMTEQPTQVWENRGSRSYSQVVADAQVHNENNQEPASEEGKTPLETNKKERKEKKKQRQRKEKKKINMIENDIEFKEAEEESQKSTSDEEEMSEKTVDFKGLLLKIHSIWYSRKSYEDKVFAVFVAIFKVIKTFVSSLISGRKIYETVLNYMNHG
ncbi:unnamed protein product [Parnassius mnemosyne]|uniref:Reverse transcriptase n=2 Tax=Parnassius mnemosyne TaxID=213953 RepID=A0AAV1KRR8_9NEOP